jgi:hypothetical protein
MLRASKLGQEAFVLVAESANKEALEEQGEATAAVTV